MAFISQNRFGSTHSSLAKIASPFMRLASRVQTDWRQRQTERILESLPAEIRKDIGWPSGDGNHEAKHIH